MKERTNRMCAGKVFLTILLIVTMTLLLTACTNDTAKTTATQAPTVEPTEQPTAAPIAESTAVPTVESTAEPAAQYAVNDLMDAEGIIEPTSEPLSVETENFAFTISGEITEKVFCRESAEDPENQIEVCTVLNDQEYILITILFNQTEGDIVQMISDAAGNKIPVAFVMNALPEGLAEEAADEFYSAQGVVNQIIETIQAR